LQPGPTISRLLAALLVLGGLTGCGSAAPGSGAPRCDGGARPADRWDSAGPGPDGPTPPAGDAPRAGEDAAAADGSGDIGAPPDGGSPLDAAADAAAPPADAGDAATPAPDAVLPPDGGAAPGDVRLEVASDVPADVPAHALPDVPAHALPGVPAHALPDVPADVPARTLPDVPADAGRADVPPPGPSGRLLVTELLASNDGSLEETLSVVMEPDDLWGAETGIYVHSTQRGAEWERPASVELILGDGRTGFAETCGVRIHGYGWRPHAASRKHSLRLEFRRLYGKRKSPYTRDVEWAEERRRLTAEYFPARTAVLIEQLRAAGLYTDGRPPAGCTQVACTGGDGYSVSRGGGRMPSLQIRELDPETYERLRAAARRERRSLAQQAAVTLRRAVADAPSSARERRVALLQRIAEESTDLTASELPDPVVLLREDRER
jgi:hypothetical protein